MWTSSYGSHHADCGFALCMIEIALLASPLDFLDGLKDHWHPHLRDCIMGRIGVVGILHCIIAERGGICRKIIFFFFSRGILRLYHLLPRPVMLLKIISSSGTKKLDVLQTLNEM